MKRRKFRTITWLLIIAASGLYVVKLRAEPSKHYAQVFYNKLENCEGVCDSETSAKLADTILKYDDTFSLAYTKLGNIIGRQGDLEKAFDYHYKAILYDHLNISSLTWLGKFYYSKSDCDRAMRYLMKSYSVWTSNSDVNYYMGRCYEKDNNMQMANRYYMKAYARNANSMEALARYGATEHLKGKTERALSFVEIIKREGNIQLAQELLDYLQNPQSQEFRPDEKVVF